MNIAIIGAGIGGLSAASLLSHAGHRVTVFEKNGQPGGKMNRHTAAGFRFDTGPSLLTMPHVAEELFERCGASLSNYVSIEPLDLLCRYIYPDGTVFNCYQDATKTAGEIEKFAPQDVAHYYAFLEYAETLFNRTKQSFLENPLYDWSDLSALNFTDIFKIDTLQTVAGRVDKQFQSPYMRQFFKRFATYNGSSPFRAPATLNVIPHVELSMGGYYIKGGIYKLARGLEHLAKENGASINYNCEINKISIDDGRATGVIADGNKFTTDIVLSNCDATVTYENLLTDAHIPFYKQKKLAQVEPSCSGFVLLLGIDKQYEQLGHHTILFSKDYEREFDAIFNRNVMPDDPTIYVANTSAKNPEHAISGGSNLFVLVNAPYLSTHWNWKEKEKKYANFVIKELESRGLKDLRDSIVCRHHITPLDFQNRYYSNKGSIYGTSSNSKTAAFLRPKNKSRHIDGLYLAGGSTHPGGGIPLVMLSAFNAVALIERYEA